MNKIVYGMEGEKIALKYLKKHKYKIIETNYTNTLGEIDIIAKHKGFLVFIEVKSRSGTMFGLPCEAVDAHKQYKIIQVAKSYLKHNNLFNVPVRFDVVEVLSGKVNLIEGAFTE